VARPSPVVALQLWRDKQQRLLHPALQLKSRTPPPKRACGLNARLPPASKGCTSHTEGSFAAVRQNLLPSMDYEQSGCVRVFQFGPSATRCSRVVQVRYTWRIGVLQRPFPRRFSFAQVAAARNRLLQLLALSGRGQRHFTTSTLAFVAASIRKKIRSALSLSRCASRKKELPWQDSPVWTSLTSTRS